MVLTTPVEMHAYSLQKCTCTCACAPMQWCRSFFAMKAFANVSWVLCEHRAGCRLPTALIALSTLFARNPSKSMLTHIAIAAAMSHKHHSIIRVSAGLIEFVYGSHSKRGPGAHPLQRSVFSIFCAGFFRLYQKNAPQVTFSYIWILMGSLFYWYSM